MATQIAYEVEATINMTGCKIEFRPFTSIEKAEQCLLVLAGRNDIRSAEIFETLIELKTIKGEEREI